MNLTHVAIAVAQMVGGTTVLKQIPTNTYFKFATSGEKGFPCLKTGAGGWYKYNGIAYKGDGATPVIPAPVEA